MLEYYFLLTAPFCILKLLCIFPALDISLALNTAVSTEQYSRRVSTSDLNSTISGFISHIFKVLSVHSIIFLDFAAFVAGGKFSKPVKDISKVSSDIIIPKSFTYFLCSKKWSVCSTFSV